MGYEYFVLSMLCGAFLPVGLLILARLFCWGSGCWHLPVQKEGLGVRRECAGICRFPRKGACALPGPCSGDLPGKAQTSPEFNAGG